MYLEKGYNKFLHFTAKLMLMKMSEILEEPICAELFVLLSFCNEPDLNYN